MRENFPPHGIAPHTPAREGHAAPTPNALLRELQAAPRKRMGTQYVAPTGESLGSRVSEYDAFGRLGLAREGAVSESQELHAAARAQAGILITAIYNTLRGKTVAPSQARAVAQMDMAYVVRALDGAAPTKARIAEVLRLM